MMYIYKHVENSQVRTKLLGSTYLSSKSYKTVGMSKRAERIVAYNVAACRNTSSSKMFMVYPQGENSLSDT